MLVLVLVLVRAYAVATRKKRGDQTFNGAWQSTKLVFAFCVNYDTRTCDHEKTTRL